MTNGPISQPALSHAAVRAVMLTLIDPRTGAPLDPAVIDGIAIEGTTVTLALRGGKDDAPALTRLADQARASLAPLGAAPVRMVLTAHRPTQPDPRPADSRPARPARPLLLGEVGAIVAVASGKGGVGKSTVAVNLAVALAQAGLRVGLLDADIHGPSLPTMLGAHARPEVQGDRIQPITAWGISAMSIGFMVDQAAAMIWRGPMVMGALEQLLGQVDWGAPDVLIVDMPPGTGDAQLSLAQRVRLAGAVIVSTPQDVALIDARRGVRMFEQTGVPVLGLVENMSFFCCPSCGTRSDIFGHGGARAEARRLGVPFLGEIPLLLAVRAAGDAGTPIVAAAPDSPAASAFRTLAGALRDRLGGGAS